MKTIDLGLSVDWGETNLGAKIPSEYGMYLSWSSNSEGDVKGMPLYEHPTKCISGNTDYAPCTNQLGNGWRLPTKEEFEELLNKCDIEPCTCEDKKGMLFISTINQKRIFLPAAGCKSSQFFSNKKDYSIGKELYYWSADFDDSHVNEHDQDLTAYALLSADGIKCELSKYNWTVRFSIRPVKDKDNN